MIMKTIEQKAKAYDKALERAKEKYTTCYSPALLEYIFPELNESNDKEIREDIINNLKRYINCIKDGYDAPSAKDFVVKEIEKQIAWLEKQDNKSVNIDIESMVSSYKQRLKSQTGIRAENNPLVNMSLIAFRHGVENTLEELNLKKLEKQGDKDSQIKLPTFTFDDILALQCCMETVKKVQNDKDLYEKLNELHGRVYDAYHLEKQGEPNPYSGVSFEYNGHTWGMCARDGGVEILVDGEIKEKVFLDNKQQDKSALETIREENTDNQNCGIPVNNVKPKIENEIEIPFSAKDSELQETTYFIPKGFHAEIDDDKVVIKKGEKPAAWSKKDEKMFEYALNMIEWYSGKNEDKSRFVSDWLKTLKQRIGG